MYCLNYMYFIHVVTNIAAKIVKKMLKMLNTTYRPTRAPTTHFVDEHKIFKLVLSHKGGQLALTSLFGTKGRESLRRVPFRNLRNS